MFARAFTLMFLVAAVVGLVFTSLSTSDFVQHLDRQVHNLHCSFVPGAAASTDLASGCHVALMSTWSSVLRTVVWGGFPVALPGIAVFAFLIFRGVDLLVRPVRDRGAAWFVFVCTLVPLVTSLVFGGIAIFELDAFCRTCAGIYFASGGVFLSSIGILAGSYFAGDADAQPTHDEGEGDGEGATAAPPAAPDHPALTWGIGALELGAFVLAPIALYWLAVPNHGKYVGTCGELADTTGIEQVLVPIGHARGGRTAVEVFDPLCPACKGFERRLGASGYAEGLDRKALLFPLDSTCNWMVSSSMHPGACSVSEAVLCAGDDAQRVIDWAFEHQVEIRDRTTADPKAAEAMVDAAFPAVAKCTGSANARQRLNRSLRWAVQNQLPVLTPQLYVDGKKVCDEDTDLGLDFALSRMVGN